MARIQPARHNILHIFNTFTDDEQSTRISRTEAQIHTYTDTEHGVYRLYFLYHRQLLL